MRQRRAIAVFIAGVGCVVALVFGVTSAVKDSLPTILTAGLQQQGNTGPNPEVGPSDAGKLAMKALDELEVKGRAAKTGYSRKEFGNGWGSVQGCTTRNIILNRDMQNVVVNEKCQVVSGILNDPYSGKTIEFNKNDGAAVQIDHVIALSDAWQKGAQMLSKEERVRLANDPLELLAVAGADNQQKSDADAASWLPKNKAFRCTYIARQIAIKIKYSLWNTPAEHDAMRGVLGKCPEQRLPV